MEKYFVCSSSDGDIERIFFGFEEAKQHDSDYIDSFDYKGQLVDSYKNLVEDGVSTGYTTDF